MAARVPGPAAGSMRCVGISGPSPGKMDGHWSSRRAAGFNHAGIWLIAGAEPFGPARRRIILIHYSWGKPMLAWIKSIVMLVAAALVLIGATGAIAEPDK